MKSLNVIFEAVFKIRPEEQKTVFLMFLYTMCAVAAPSVIGRTISNTLFLQRVDKAYLPLTYIAIAVAAILVSILLSKLGNKFRRDRVMKLTAIGVALTILVFRGLVEIAPTSLVVLGLFYLLVEIMGDLLILQFWTFANDIFTGRSAKRLFGFIAGGGTVSFVLFAVLVRSTIKTVGAPNLMFVMAALVMLLLVPIHYLGKLYSSKLDDAVEQSKTKKQGMPDGNIRKDFAEVGKSKLLASIAAIIMVTTIVTACIDYQWKIAIQSKFINDEVALGAYFSSFYLFAGLFQLIFQFVLSARILEKLGIFLGLSLLPGSIFIMSLAIILGWGNKILFLATSGAKASDMIFRFTVNNTSLQILYLPVSSELRARAKVIIDGMIKPCAAGFTGFLILGITVFSGERTLSLIAIIMVLGWIVLVPLALRHYKLALADSIRRKSIDLSEEYLVLDDATSRSLLEALNGDNENDAFNALELLKSFPGKNWDRHVVKLLSSHYAGLRIGALQHLGRKGNTDFEDQIEDYFSDEDPEVKAAAVGALCALGEERIIERLRPFLNDDDTDIKVAVVAGMIQHGGLDGILSAASVLKDMLDNEDWKMRQGGARVLKKVRVSSFYQPLIPLIEDDEDARVRMAAIQAAGEICNLKLVPSLVSRLVDKSTSLAAMIALANYGDEVIDLLDLLLSSSVEDKKCKEIVPRILDKIRTPRALKCLVKHLDQEDEVIRHQFCHAINRVMSSSAEVDLNREAVYSALEREVKDYFQQTMILYELRQHAEPMLLRDALEYRRGKTRERVLHLLSALYARRKQKINSIAYGLMSSQVTTRSNSLELLEGIIFKEEKSLKARIIAMFEDGSLIHKAKIANRLYPALNHYKAVDRVKSLVEDKNRWIAACAIFQIKLSNFHELVDDVVRNLSAKDYLIRETAHAVAESMLTNEEYSKLI